MWARVIAGVLVPAVCLAACTLGFETSRYLGATGGSGGTTSGAGGGESCFEPFDCTLPTPCWVATCHQQRCVLAPLPTMINLPANEQTVGDCRVLSCDGEGNVRTLDSPTDAEDDGLDCTKDACVDGSTTHTDEPLDTKCGGSDATVCDGAGHCVGCSNPIDCGTNAECTSYTCVNGTCGTVFAPQETPLAQTPGDCKARVCNVQGEVVVFPDPTDTPTDPNKNDCETWVCVGTDPTPQPVPDGTSCGPNGNMVCCDGGCSCSTT